MIAERIIQFDKDDITESLHAKGYALVKQMIGVADCENLVQHYNDEGSYRKTVIMEHHGYGLGEYKYFQYLLPPLVQQLREGIYPVLAPVANQWMQVLNIAQQYPPELAGLLELCHAREQLRPTALILKYRVGGYNALHQDLYGEVFFPMQLVLFLDEPGKDYDGGEFVLIEQRPRMQSKPVVLRPAKGDMLIFTTNFRPVKGSRGYYRVNMKHGVSEVTAGTRHTLGVIFHDAK